MGKTILVYLLLLLSIISTQACSNCQTREIDASGVDEPLSFLLTITSPPFGIFERDYADILDLQGSAGFSFRASYNLPGEESSEEARFFQFSFRFDALPDEESIFEQSVGDIILIGESAGQVYGDTPVFYREIFLDESQNTPTSYNGSVSILDDPNPDGDRIAEFDIEFVFNEEVSHRVRASYSFRLGTAERQVGECDF